MAGNRTRLEAGRLRRLKELFELALDVPEPDWGELVARECAGAPELSAELRALLEAHKQRDEFLDRSIPERLLEAATATADASLRGVELNGRYLLECEVGRGGFGTVYLAQDSRMLGRQVAVKVLHRQAGADLALETELAALAPLHHHAIATPYDSGRTPDGRRFLVLDYVAGPSLRKALAVGPMAAARVARLARALGAALRIAHSCAIWHLDLKPENILLRDGEPGEETPVIVDFGIARIGATQSGGRLGSPSYAAPEQLAGTPGAASDQYSLALILMEALTGRRAAIPREGRTVPIEAGVPPRAAGVLARALSLDPHDRYGSVVEFTTELARALRPRRQTLRLLAQAAAALAVVVLLIGLAAWRTSREQRRVESAELEVLASQLSAQIQAGSVSAIAPVAIERGVGEIVRTLDVRFQRGSRDELLLATLSRGLMELGTTHGNPGRRVIGRSDLGAEYLRRSVELRDQLVARHQRNLNHKLIACEYRNAQATVLVELGRYREAEMVVREALMRLNLAENWGRSGPARPAIVAVRAPLLLTLSRIPFHQRRFSECLRFRNQGVEGLRLLWLMADVSDPTHVAKRVHGCNLAGALAARGYLLREMGRHDEALHDYAESDLLILEYLHAMPHDFTVRWSLMRNSLEVGRTYLAMGDAAKAAARLSATAQKMRELLAGSGEDLTGIRAFAMTLSALGLAQARLNGPQSEVRRLAEESLQLNSRAAKLDPQNAKVRDEAALIRSQAAEAGVSLN